MAAEGVRGGLGFMRVVLRARKRSGSANAVPHPAVIHLQQAWAPQTPTQNPNPTTPSNPLLPPLPLPLHPQN